MFLDIEERRQRILRKIEQAKMVWRSSMMGETPEGSSRENLEASSSTQQDTSGVDTGETGCVFNLINKNITAFSFERF